MKHASILAIPVTVTCGIIGLTAGITYCQYHTRNTIFFNEYADMVHNHNAYSINHHICRNGWCRKNTLLVSPHNTNSHYHRDSILLRIAVTPLFAMLLTPMFLIAE